MLSVAHVKVDEAQAKLRAWFHATARDATFATGTNRSHTPHDLGAFLVLWRQLWLANTTETS